MATWEPLALGDAQALSVHCVLSDSGRVREGGRGGTYTEKARVLGATSALSTQTSSRREKAAMVGAFMGWEGLGWEHIGNGQTAAYNAMGALVQDA